MEVTKPDISVVEFKFDIKRPKFVLEVGPGGPATICYRLIQRYLKKIKANYGGIDPNPVADNSFKIYEADPKFGWAKNAIGIVEELEGYSNKADQVWMGNFKDMGQEGQDQFDLGVFRKVFDILGENKKLIFVNHFDDYSDEREARIIENMQKAGFKVKKVDFESNKHPFIAFHKAMQSSILTNNVALIATKP